MSVHNARSCHLSCLAGGAVPRIPPCSNEAIWQWPRDGQANSQSNCGVENPGNQGPTAVQNLAPPSLLPPMQIPRPPTPVLAPTKSNSLST